MLSEHISGEKVSAAAIRSSSVMITLPPVVMLMTASQLCLMRGKNWRNTSGSGDGRPSLGSRACRCRIVAPALAASIDWVAIWSGVIGSASDMVGVWIEPVMAQVMTTLLASWGIDVSLFGVLYQSVWQRTDPPRHGRACPGHPRLAFRKTWMPAPSAGMTTERQFVE